MGEKIITILKHQYSYNYLCFACATLILIYTFQRRFSINSSIIAIIWLIILIILLVVLIIIIYVILKDDSKKEFTERMKLCHTCAKDISKYQFANFDFLTFDELIEIEASLKNDKYPEKCFVYIYTSDISTEDDAEEVVIENIAAGVNYKVFYIDGKPTQKQIDLYKKENLIECIASAIDRSADFDIMIYIDSSQNIKGYFCVNFSKAKGPRPCSQGYICNNECHYENENLLYKKIRDDTVEILLRTLRTQEQEVKL